MHVFFCVSKNVSVSCAYTQGKREQFSGFNRTLDAINNVFRKFSAFHDETGRLNVDGMNIISNDGSNKLNRSRKARVSYKVQRTINASLNAATSTRAVSSNQVPRLTLMSLIKMMLVMVSVAAISKTFGLLRFLLRLSFLAKRRLLPHLLTLWVCKLLMLICILTKNVITSCSVTMMLFLHLEVKPLMTLTTVLYLSCALISGHLAMMLMELTKRR